MFVVLDSSSEASDGQGLDAAKAAASEAEELLKEPAKTRVYIIVCMYICMYIYIYICI